MAKDKQVASSSSSSGSDPIVDEIRNKMSKANSLLKLFNDLIDALDQANKGKHADVSSESDIGRNIEIARQRLLAFFRILHDEYGLNMMIKKDKNLNYIYQQAINAINNKNECNNDTARTLRKLVQEKLLKDFINTVK